MKHIYLKLMLIITIFSGCSPYSHVSKHNKVITEDGFVVFSNETLNLRSTTFGDFKFANKAKEFKRINTNNRAAFRNVLLYAKTITAPQYEYYLLLNPGRSDNPGFIFRETTIDNNRITLAISKNAPQEDIEFIATKIAEFKTTTAYNTTTLVPKGKKYKL